MGIKERLKAHLGALSLPRNPLHHKPAHLEAQRYLCDALAEMGREVSRQEFPTGIDGLQISGCNIMGACLEDAKLLLIAHYDTVEHSPGADDNTSAVAVALEVGRLCPHVRLLFPDLEEFGLIGARHFVATGQWAESPALVLESVGFFSSLENSQSYPEILPLAFPEHFRWLEERAFRGDFLALLHLETDRSLASSLSARLKDEALAIEVPAAMLQIKEGQALRDFGRSDHLAFWERGRSCLMLTDSANFRNPNYHRPSDKADTLDLDSMVRLTERLVDWCSFSLSVGQ